MARELVFATQPSDVRKGKAMEPAPAVELRYAGTSIVVPASGAAVSLSLGEKPFGVKIEGVLKRILTNGRAEFPGLKFPVSGSPLTLVAECDDSGLVFSRPTQWQLDLASGTGAPIGTVGVVSSLSSSRPSARVVVVGTSGGSPAMLTIEDAPNDSMPSPIWQSIAGLSFGDVVIDFGDGPISTTGHRATNAPGLDRAGAIALWQFDYPAGISGDTATEFGRRIVGGQEWALFPGDEVTYDVSAVAPTGRTSVRTKARVAIGTDPSALVASALGSEDGVTIEMLITNPSRIGGKPGFGANEDGTERLRFGLSGDAGNAYEDSTTYLGATATPTFGEVPPFPMWHLVALTARSGEIRIYQDGQQFGGSSQAAPDQFQAVGSFVWGQTNRNALTTDLRFSEARITPGIRSPEEILEQARRCGVTA